MSTVEKLSNFLPAESNTDTSILRSWSHKDATRFVLAIMGHVKPSGRTGRASNWIRSGSAQMILMIEEIVIGLGKE